MTRSISSRAQPADDDAEARLQQFIEKFEPDQHVVSIAAAANGVGLCFINGARLPDPQNVLVGSGKQTRFIRLPSAAVLERPEVKALLAAAIADSKTRFPSRGRGKLVIRSVSPKQRPRRKSALGGKGDGG
jgi:hypothetical protein